MLLYTILPTYSILGWLPGFRMINSCIVIVVIIIVNIIIMIAISSSSSSSSSSRCIIVDSKCIPDIMIYDYSYDYDCEYDCH